METLSVRCNHCGAPLQVVRDIQSTPRSALTRRFEALQQK